MCHWTYCHPEGSSKEFGSSGMMIQNPDMTLDSFMAKVLENPAYLGQLARNILSASIKAEKKKKRGSE